MRQKIVLIIFLLSIGIGKFGLAQDKPSSVGESIETDPEYLGGMSQFARFLGRNLKYPSLARRANIQGTVIISFIVRKDGSISGVKVLKGLGAGCDEEAVRVVSMSPKWKPGTQRGEPVNVRLTIPIKFSLNQEPKNPLIVVNNKILGKAKSQIDYIKSLNNDKVADYSFLNAELAQKKYGKKAKDGALIITLKEEEEK